VVGSDNVAVYRAIKLGGTVDGKRVVRDGLRPGDQIIVNGLQRVRPGMTVAPARALVQGGSAYPASATVAAR